MTTLEKPRELEIQMNFIEMNLVLAHLWMDQGKTNLAAEHMTDARKSLKELFEGIKKAN